MPIPLIEQHGVIGNMKSAALVSNLGVIDFYCFPDFDSPSVFASLLDQEKGGSFQIEPQLSGMQSKQLYLPDTNILLTRYLSNDGIAELLDFMPVSDSLQRGNQIIRNVRVIKGEIQFRARCAPRFDYARTTHTAFMEKKEKGIRFVPQNGNIEGVTLRATVPLSIENQDGVAEFTLTQNQQATFAMGKAGEGDEALAEDIFEKVLSETSHYWREWIGQSDYQGRWREMVNRSALVLKLLSSREHGALIAAPTFGLPERIGGARNWDYRFSWLRDASFTLYAFMRLGFVHEPSMHAHYLRRRMEDGLKLHRGDGPLQPMYRIDGSSELSEHELPHLAGYRGSRPVRIGNGAKAQLQLDVYGELMDAIYLASKYVGGMSYDGWNIVRELLAWLEDNWQREDEGIWEVRNGRQHFLHSRLMCWVAFDRAIRLAEKRSLVAPHSSWLNTRDAIHEDIFQNFWSEKQSAFVQAQGSESLDASVLLMPLMRFIGATDPRWLSTMAAIEDHLSEGGLVYRYSTGTDGLDGQEGSFTACSFWLIECLARAGQIEKAELLFDKMLGYANHLGLYSEELGLNGEQLGNFPQALTHLALISAASFLDRKLSGPKNETWQ